MEQFTTVDKAFDVLLHLRASARPCGVTELSRALSMPKSSVHRLLSVLCRRGMVERDAQAGYRLGIALVALGLGALSQEPIVAAARPVLECEASELGETCFLVAARAGRLRVLDKAEGTGVLRVSPQVGAEVPVHATAAGKLYLALSPGQLDEVQEAPRYTARTPSAAEVETQLPEVAEAGYAVNVDEWIEGLSVFSAAVRGADGLLGVLAIAVPSGRAALLDRARVIERVVKAADRIAARMEGRVL